MTSTAGIQTLCTSNQGNLVAVGDRDGGVTLLDVSDILADDATPDAEPTIVGRWTGHSDRVYSAAFSPSGKHLVTCGKDGNVFRWEPAANQRAQYASMTEISGTTEHETWTAVDYSEHSQQVFAVSSSAAIDRWDVRDRKLTRLCQLDSAVRMEEILVDDKGTHLFTSDVLGTIRRFNVDPNSVEIAQAWQRSVEIDLPPRSCSFALSKDGKTLACAHTRNRFSLSLVDATTGELIANHTPKQWISTDSFGVALSPTSRGRDYGRVAYTLGGDVIVVDWVADDQSKGAIRLINERRINCGSETVSRIVFQDHSTLLATTTRNQLVKLDLTLDGKRQLFSGQPRPLKILRPLPDGREVWTALGRNTIMIWCMHTSYSLFESPIVDVGNEGSVCDIETRNHQPDIFLATDFDPLAQRLGPELAAMKRDNCRLAIPNRLCKRFPD
jgi:hypothetical protein